MTVHSYVNDERTWGSTECEECLNRVEYMGPTEERVQWLEVTHKCSFPGGPWNGEDVSYTAVLFATTSALLDAQPSGIREPLTLKTALMLRRSLNKYLSCHVDHLELPM